MKLDLSVQPWAWTSIAPMVDPRRGPSLQFIKKKGVIYVMGGTAGGVLIKKVAKYDISMDTWTYISNFYF